MTTRLPVTAAPEPLEADAAQFDDLFAQRSQRDGFRRYLEGLLLPAERNKTLTGLANTGPDVGAQHPRAQGLQWFLSESPWAAPTRRRSPPRGGCWSSTNMATASGGTRPRMAGGSSWPTWARPLAAWSR